VTVTGPTDTPSRWLRPRRWPASSRAATRLPPTSPAPGPPTRRGGRRPPSRQADGRRWVTYSAAAPTLNLPRRNAADSEHADRGRQHPAGGRARRLPPGLRLANQANSAAPNVRVRLFEAARSSTHHSSAGRRRCAKDESQLNGSWNLKIRTRPSRPGS
jgi:hypothetical protein